MKDIEISEDIKEGMTLTIKSDSVDFVRVLTAFDCELITNLLVALDEDDSDNYVFKIV